MSVLRKLLVLSWFLFFVVTPVAEELDYSILINDSPVSFVIYYEDSEKTRGFFEDLFSNDEESSSEFSLHPRECTKIALKDVEKTALFMSFGDDLNLFCSFGECMATESEVFFLSGKKSSIISPEELEKFCKIWK